MVKGFLFSLVFFLLAVSAFFHGCGENGQVPTGPSFEERENGFWEECTELDEGPVVYTVIPLDTQYIDEICPLGHLSPPGHPIPTQHTYWGLARTDLGAKVDGFAKPVKSPAKGVITKIVFTHWEGFSDYSVDIRHSKSLLTRFNHLSEIDEEILNKIGKPLEEGWDGNSVCVPVEAGDVIGKTAAAYAQSAALDMGLHDRNALSYISPEKYPVPACHAISPLENFTEPLKQLVYKKVKRVEEPRSGEFDFDSLGTLAGNWFLKGTDGWSGDDAFRNYLSFAYDVYDPQYKRVSLGQKFAERYNFGVSYLSRVNDGSLDFREVTVATGKVRYELMPVREGDEFFGRTLSDLVTNTLLVQMISETEIKIEVFQGKVDNPEFTGSALIYTR